MLEEGIVKLMRQALAWHRRKIKRETLKKAYEIWKEPRPGETEEERNERQRYFIWREPQVPAPPSSGVKCTTGGGKSTVLRDGSGRIHPRGQADRGALHHRPQSDLVPEPARTANPRTDQGDPGLAQGDAAREWRGEATHHQGPRADRRAGDAAPGLDRGADPRTGRRSRRKMPEGVTMRDLSGA